MHIDYYSHRNYSTLKLSFAYVLLQNITFGVYYKEVKITQRLLQILRQFITNKDVWFK